MLCGGGGNLQASPATIIFNKVTLLKVDFFNFGTGTANNTEATGIFKKAVANWFYATRSVSIFTLLLILIYIGIRSAISTIAEEEAKYKKWFTNWAFSLALVFLLPYIMEGIIQINNALVGLIAQSIPDQGGLVNYMNAVALRMFSPFFTQSVAAIIVYCVLIGITLGLFVAYLKRVLTIGFLIAIAPLITITYSVDKLKDGESQALNAWFKEFAYTILIQIFHAITYALFVSTAVAELQRVGSIGASFFAVVCLTFFWKAEELVRKIFGFDKSSSLGGVMASAAMVGGALGTLGKFATKKVAQKGVEKGGKALTKSDNAFAKRATSFVKQQASKVGDIKIGKGAKEATVRERYKRVQDAIDTSAGKQGLLHAPARAIKAAKSQIKDSAVLDDIKDKAKKMLDPKEQLEAAKRMALGTIAGATTLGATGKPGAALGTYMAGKALSDRMLGKYGEVSIDKQERALARAAELYKKDKGLTDSAADKAKFKKDSKYLLGQDPDDIKWDQATSNYIRALNDTHQVYQTKDIKDPAKKIEETLGKIADGKIEAPYRFTLSGKARDTLEADVDMKAVGRNLDAILASNSVQDTSTGLQAQTSRIAADIITAIGKSNLIGSAANPVNHRANLRKMSDSIDTAFEAKKLNLDVSGLSLDDQRAVHAQMDTFRDSFKLSMRQQYMTSEKTNKRNVLKTGAAPGAANNRKATNRRTAEALGGTSKSLKKFYP